MQMHPEPATITANKLASEALHCMETRKIMVLFVCDSARQTLGVVHMHDILQGEAG